MFWMQFIPQSILQLTVIGRISTMSIQQSTLIKQNHEFQLQTEHYSQNIEQMITVSEIQLNRMCIDQRFCAIQSQESSGESYFQQKRQISSNSSNFRSLNKKIQCSINYGEGEYSELMNKKQELKMLKVIKLMRVVINQLRKAQERMKAQIVLQFEKIEQNIKSMDIKWNERINIINRQLQQSQLKDNFTQLQQKSNAYQENFEVNSHLTQLRSQLHQKFLLIQQIQQKHQQQVMQYKECIGKLEGEAEQLSKQSLYLQDLVASNEVTIKSLSNLKEQMEKQIEYGQKREQLLQIENEQLKQKINERYDQVERIKKQKKILESKYETLENQYQNAVSQLKQATASYEKMLRQVELEASYETNKIQQFFKRQSQQVREEFEQQSIKIDTLTKKLSYQENVYQKLFEKQQSQIEEMKLIQRSSQASINLNSQCKARNHQNITANDVSSLRATQKWLGSNKQNQPQIGHWESSKLIDFKNRAKKQPSISKQAAEHQIAIAGKSSESNCFSEIKNKLTNRTINERNTSILTNLSQLVKIKSVSPCRQQTIKTHIKQTDKWGKFASSEGLIRVNQQILNMEVKLGRLKQNLSRQIKSSHYF